MGIRAHEHNVHINVYTGTPIKLYGMHNRNFHISHYSAAGFRYSEFGNISESSNVNYDCVVVVVAAVAAARILLRLGPPQFQQTGNRQHVCRYATANGNIVIGGWRRGVIVVAYFAAIISI